MGCVNSKTNKIAGVPVEQRVITPINQNEANGAFQNNIAPPQLNGHGVVGNFGNYTTTADSYLEQSSLPAPVVHVPTTPPADAAAHPNAQEATPEVPVQPPTQDTQQPELSDVSTAHGTAAPKPAEAPTSASSADGLASGEDPATAAGVSDGAADTLATIPTAPDHREAPSSASEGDPGDSSCSGGGVGPPASGAGSAVLVLWDIENCGCPPGIPIADCIRYMKSAFATIPKRRPVEIKIALTMGSFQTLIGNQLSNIPGDVDVLVLPYKSQQSPAAYKTRNADTKLTRAGRLFCDYTARDPGTVVVISGDSDFCDFMRYALDQRGCRVELLYNDATDRDGRLKTAQVMLDPNNNWSWQWGWSAFIASWAQASPPASAAAPLAPLAPPGGLTLPAMVGRGPAPPAGPPGALNPLVRGRWPQQPPGVMAPPPPPPPPPPAGVDNCIIFVKGKPAGSTANKAAFEEALRAYLRMLPGFEGMPKATQGKRSWKGVKKVFATAKFKTPQLAGSAIGAMNGMEIAEYRVKVDYYVE